ncbi:hypothetical protein [Vibrio parahaemolyticus]|uniref:hypothetical protein n=1 Tax=Vibrio parahaemolyticus TaxID=670 RepID=UPI0011217CC6|nr:hypothetical protein [Vibrio parahaemolyticus]UJW92796.1 hypothetical protein JHS83_25210 [Vibrio parahaemolyticus]UJX06961.1 hypothetical protein JHS88_24860 [Vibrio parahaemolyticus]UJX06976.1 hypothetical protein JHS88_25350 [Vibrio parahaemolyticus]WCZ09816.1 hypothetical protein GSR97_26540 [Vibrio parahaemolyticus]WCZ14719.1 hypothetical protein GSS20_25715 [Vibrio parahaemolyticus]
MDSKLKTGFQRNVELEQSIDIKLMGKSLLISLFTYMNAINLHLDDEFQLSKILHHLSIRHYCDQLKNSELLQEERQYLNELLEYIKQLINQINRPHEFNYQVVFDSIVKSMENNLKSEEIFNDILVAIEPYGYNRIFSITCGKDNIGFYFHDWGKRIFIINNPGTFFAEKSSRMTDVYIKNAEMFPDSIIENKLYLNSIMFIEGHERIVNNSFIYKAVMELEQLKSFLTDTKTLYDKVTGLIEQLKCLEFCKKEKFPINNKSFLAININDVEQVRRRLYNLSGGIEEVLYKKANTPLLIVKTVNMYLTLWLTCAKQHKSIANSIEFSLNEIRRNNTLNLLSGQKKGYETAFKEENLSGILASNLRCIYRDFSFINISTETWTARGRTDVKILINKEAVAIIESKLLFTINYHHKNEKVLSNYTNKTKEGLNQLFNRYAEYESLNNSNEIELYLALFVYDANMQHLTTTVLDAVEGYAKEKQFTYTLLSCKTNTLIFTYTSDREFENKQSCITVHLCNLELNYKNSR